MVEFSYCFSFHVLLCFISLYFFCILRTFCSALFRFDVFFILFFAVFLCSFFILACLGGAFSHFLGFHFGARFVTV